MNLKFDLVVQRRNSVPLNRMPDDQVLMPLIKLVTDCFDYFNTAYPESLPNLIVDELIEAWGRYSAAEIVRAIVEGRRSQGDLYGKLSAKHFTEWMEAYSGRVGDALANYERNKWRQPTPEVDAVLEKLGENFKPRPKREFTPEQIADAERERLARANPERDARSREWTPDKGDYRKWMEGY